MQKTIHISYLKVIENLPIIYNVETQNNYSSPGERLHAARVKAHLSIKELSYVSGVSTNTISAAENERLLISAPVLNKLSKILNVPVWYLGHYENLPEDTFGNKLYKAMLYHGYHKNDLASLLNVDPHTISEWEQNKCIPEKQHMTTLNKYLLILSK